MFICVLFFTCFYRFVGIGAPHLVCFTVLDYILLALLFSGSHVISLEEVELGEDMAYEEYPMQLLDHRVRRMRNREVQLVKVLWSHFGAEEATWETKESMREEYSELFGL